MPHKVNPIDFENSEGNLGLANAIFGWELHRRLRLHCVTRDISLMHFVAAAVVEKLGPKRGSKKRTT